MSLELIEVDEGGLLLLPLDEGILEPELGKLLLNPLLLLPRKPDSEGFSLVSIILIELPKLC